MFAKAKPGTAGAAARLPKKPGTQKLTPPSSALAFGPEMATNASAAAERHATRYRPLQGFPLAACELLRLAIIVRPPIPASLSRELARIVLPQSRSTKRKTLCIAGIPAFSPQLVTNPSHR